MADKAMSRLDRIIERLQEKFPDITMPEVEINLQQLIGIVAATGLMALEGDNVARGAYDGAEKAYEGMRSIFEYYAPGDDLSPNWHDIVPNPHFRKKLEHDATDYSKTPNYEQRRDDNSFYWVRRLRPQRETWLGPFSEWRVEAYHDDIFRMGEHVEPDAFISQTGYENQIALAESLGLVLLGDRNRMWDVLVAWEREWLSYLKLVTAVATPVVLIFGMPVAEKLIESFPEIVKGIGEVVPF